jgi:hypothetical protein
MNTSQFSTVTIRLSNLKKDFAGSIKSWALNHSILLASVLAACITIPCWSLNPDFFADDFLQLQLLKTSPYSTKRLFDVFTFFDGSRPHIQRLMETGALPWFSSPELKISFWRPLSALLIEIDYKFGGINPSFAKAHSIVWYFLIILVVGVLYRVVLPRNVAFLSLVIFVLAPNHREPVQWLAARNALVTGTLGAASLMFYVKWRQGGSVLFKSLSIVMFAAALLGGEASIGVIPYIIAFEYSKCGIKKETLRRLLPILALATVWLVGYYLLGYGVRASGGYVNPLEEPFQFIRSIPAKSLAMFGIEFGGVPAELFFPNPEYRDFVVKAGLFAVVVLLAMLAFIWNDLDSDLRKTTLWLGAGAVGAFIPQMAGLIGARSLVLSSIGGSAVLAVLIGAFFKVRDRRPRRIRDLMVLTSCVAMAIIHLAVAPVMWFHWSRVLGGINASLSKLEISSLSTSEISHERIIFISGPLSFLRLYTPARRMVENASVPLSWWTLSFVQTPQRLVRTASERFTLELIEGRMLDTPVEELYRSPDLPLKAGAEVVLNGLRAEVLADDGIGPTRVEFCFDRSLDDPSMRLMVWKPGHGFQRIKPPPTGSAMLLP